MTAREHPDRDLEDHASTTPDARERPRDSRRARRRPPAEQVLRLRTPEDLLALVPYLVGFHPEESVVLLGLESEATRAPITFSCRVDLPPPQFPVEDQATVAQHLAGILRRNRACSVVLVIYTVDPARIKPFVEAISNALDDAGIDTRDTICADGQRWWSLHCTSPTCCPPAGVPYDLAGNPAAASAVYHGMVALSSEAELRAQVAPAEDRSGIEGALREVDITPAEFADAVGFIDRLLASWRAQHRTPTDHEVAMLITRLADPAVAEHTWGFLDHENADTYVDFWSDVARRAVPPYEGPALAQLAYAAWLAGHGAMAGRAVERALTIDPDDTQAIILFHLLLAGIRPWIATGPDRSVA